MLTNSTLLFFTCKEQSDMRLIFWNTMVKTCSTFLVLSKEQKKLYPEYQ